MRAAAAYVLFLAHLIQVRVPFIYPNRDDQPWILFRIRLIRASTLPRARLMGPTGYVRRDTTSPKEARAK